ncbi:Putative AC transposase [Linum perenne]
MEDEHQETGEGSETIISKKKRKRSTLRSPHWKDFPPIYVFEGDPPTEVRKAKCKHCGFLVATNLSYHGTNGLKNHTETCVNKHLELEKQPGLSFQTSSTGDGGAYIPWRFDQVDTRLAFAEILMIDDQPFKYVERVGFKHFMSRACPMFIFPCRKTVRTDCVKLFLERKESLKTFFKYKGMGRVSITTDCWTSLRNVNYIAITAHFISRNWQLHKRIICFRKITSHKGEDIAN